MLDRNFHNSKVFDGKRPPLQYGGYFFINQENLTKLDSSRKVFWKSLSSGGKFTSANACTYNSDRHTELPN